MLDVGMHMKQHYNGFVSCTGVQYTVCCTSCILSRTGWAQVLLLFCWCVIMVH